VIFGLVVHNGFECGNGKLKDLGCQSGFLGWLVCLMVGKVESATETFNVEG
jgi:hypothetical protein